jgi:hypothetical protein
MPSNLFTYVNGLTVTIKKGEQFGTLKIKTNTNNFDLDELYALAFRLKSVDKPGYILSGNYNTFVTFIGARNEYEGNYLTNGVRTRYNGSTVASGVLDNFPFSAQVKQFYTVNANTIQGILADATGSGVIVNYTINADNSVTIISQVGTNPVGANINDPAAPSTWNPDTRTFTIRAAYLNTANALRTVTETMVQQ